VQAEAGVVEEADRATLMGSWASGEAGTRTAVPWASRRGGVGSVGPRDGDERVGFWTVTT
jgi:hypothetical protein